jgi:hypothetical protein
MIKKWVLIFIGLCLVLIFVYTAICKENQGETKLTDADCIKCHKKEVSFINTAGGKHQGVGCLGCHGGHFPAISKEQMIPSCSKCHTGKEHYTLTNCSQCHQNPHTPLDIPLKGSYKKECVSCHKNVGEEIEKFKSKHTNLACNVCHLKHREKPECLRCHKGHIIGQSAKDCSACHKPHSPLKIAYSPEISNSLCAPCHQKEDSDLKATTTKHNALKCAFCHRNEHKAKPTCESCHSSTPHPQAMLAKFKKCVDCHNDAHLLIK